MPQYGHGNILTRKQVAPGRYEYGADVPRDPVWQVCDCCLIRVDRIWFYQQRGFCPLLRDQAFRGNSIEFMEGEWAFCVYCHQLWLDRNLAGLLKRVATLNPGTPRDALHCIYYILPQVLHGGVQYWEATP